MIAFGGIVSAPGYHYWYKGIEKLLPGQGNNQVARKVILDQSIAAPLVISSFFIFTGYLDNYSIAGSINKWKDNFLPAMKYNYIIWPTAAFINYKFIPTQHRILYISTVGLLWGTILSLISNSKKQN